MRSIIYKSFSLLLLICCSYTMMAQQKDSVIIVTTHFKNDSVGKQVYYYKQAAPDSAWKISDSSYYKRRIQYKSMDSLQRMQFRKTKDTLFKKYQLQYKRMDTLKRMNKMRYDSLYKAQKFAYKKMDSLHKNMVYRKYPDSVFKKQQLEFRKTDSLYRKNMQYKRADTLYRKQNLQFKRMDSLRRMNTYQKFPDSGFKKGLYKMTDTLKFKTRLKKLNVDLKRLNADSIDKANNPKSKEISIELKLNGAKTLYIQNPYRKVIIKQGSGNAVKITTTVYFKEDPKLSDAGWFEKLQLQLKGSNDSIIIKGVAVNGSVYGEWNTPDQPDVLNLKNNSKRAVTIYIPAGIKLSLQSKYADVQIDDKLTYLEASMINGNLVMLDADRAIIRNMYGSVTCGTIKDATLLFNNCRFTGDDIDKLTIDSKNSVVRFNNSTTVSLASVNDHYNMAAIDFIEGKKVYGKLNIGYLKNNMVLTGNSADITVERIDVNTNNISIDNKYADIKMPVYALVNYTILYEGSYKNVAAVSTKQNYTINGNGTSATINGVAKASQTLTVSDSTAAGGRSTKYEASAGDVAGKHTSVHIKCDNCSVDFKQ